jgi:uncharacterized membrane protein YvlD (DUF360 family)
MNYLKSLFFNFLAAFFANHVLPGIDVISQTKLPHIGGDLLFAILLGFINSLIYPILKLVQQPASFIRIAAVALIVNFVGYAILKFVPTVGIKISSIEGYALAAAVTTIASALTNFLEMKRHCHHKPECPKNDDLQMPQ